MIDYLRGTLQSPVPREYVRLFPETLRRLQAPPGPPFSRPTRVCSAISARGGPGRSEPRRRRRGSRGGADGDRGGATGQAPLCVYGLHGVGVSNYDQSASPAKHGDSLCPQPPHLAQPKEPPAAGTHGLPRE